MVNLGIVGETAFTQAAKSALAVRAFSTAVTRPYLKPRPRTFENSRRAMSRNRKEPARSRQLVQIEKRIGFSLAISADGSNGHHVVWPGLTTCGTRKVRFNY